MQKGRRSSLGDMKSSGYFRVHRRGFYGVRNVRRYCIAVSSEPEQCNFTSLPTGLEFDGEVMVYPARYGLLDRGSV
jgi:hypothetical protein